MARTKAAMRNRRLARDELPRSVHSNLKKAEVKEKKAKALEKRKQK